MHIFSVSLIIMYTNSVYFMILLCTRNDTCVCVCASCTCIVDYATGFIITFVSIFRYIIVYIYSVTQFVICLLCTGLFVKGVTYVIIFRGYFLLVMSSR